MIKHFQTLTFAIALLIGLSFELHAQTRSVGGHAIVLDDGSGHTLTILPSLMTTDQIFTFPATTSYTPGSVLFADANGEINQDNAKLFWDNTNFRLGIGNASPLYPLDVTGAARITGAVTLGTALATSSGGTGTSTAPTQNGVIYGASSSAYASTAAGSTGQVLTVSGGGQPAWAASSGSMLIALNSGGNLVDFDFMTTGGEVSSESSGQYVVTQSGTLQNLYVHITAAPGAGNGRYFYVRKNGVNTALGLTMGSNTTSASDVSDKVSVSAGDLISLETITNNTPPAATGIASFEIAY